MLYEERTFLAFPIRFDDGPSLKRQLLFVLRLLDTRPSKRGSWTISVFLEYVPRLRSDIRGYLIGRLPRRSDLQYTSTCANCCTKTCRKPPSRRRVAPVKRVRSVVFSGYLLVSRESLGNTPVDFRPYLILLVSAIRSSKVSFNRFRFSVRCANCRGTTPRYCSNPVCLSSGAGAPHMLTGSLAVPPMCLNVTDQSHAFHVHV